MLSRVAERVYWTARYLDRIENTARLIDSYNKLLLDLPGGLNFNWYHLITLNKSEKAFMERYKNADERSVVKFLIGEKTNPSSILSSLKLVRENIRTTRDVLPEVIWVLINELSLYVEDNIQKGINRTKRAEFVDAIIYGCFQINGLLQSAMPHDAVWYFMRMGQQLERADMTTRLLDAGAAVFIALQEQEPTINSHQAVWGNILLTLGAQQPYRRTTRSAISAKKVIHYLLEDRCLPSSIAYCISSIRSACDRLPEKKSVLQKIEDIEKDLFLSMDYTRLDESFRDYLNNLQLAIASIHQAINDNWFPVYTPERMSNSV